MSKELIIASLLLVPSLALYADDDIADKAKQEAAEVEKAKKTLVENQDTIKWHFPKTVGLNLGQTAYQNWAEGGENTVSFSGYLDLQANYKHNKQLWNNDLYAEYGIIYSNSYDDYETRKSLDKLAFTSRYGYKALKSWYYSALVDFKTQFDCGYDYTIDDDTKQTERTLNSKFMAPGYLVTSLGMDYIPNKYVSVFISPATGRFTFCQDTALSTKCGIDEGDKYKAEFGAYLRVLNDFDIAKNIHLTSKLDLFSAYETFGNTVVNWDVLIAMKVNKYINASIRGQLKYDDAVPYIDPDDKDKKERGARVQLMDAITVGLTYKF